MRAACVSLLLAVAMIGAVLADDVEDARAAYARFLAAQNARDVPAMRELLSASPGFLWISDGKPYWGREAMLERLGSFQRNAVWVAAPALERGRAERIAPGEVVMAFPLRLRIAERADAPADVLDFLVTALFRREEGTWRIVGLYTTAENRS
jgi:ketosteroid isomerase-like protein